MEKKKKKKKQQEKVEGLKLKSDFILDPWDVDREVWREKRRWTKFWLDFSSTHFKSSEIFSSISIAHYYKCNLHRSSLHSSLIFHHLYFISKGLKKGVIVQSQDLKRMKAGDSATAISKHNYISYGLPSLDDLKRLRALPFSRLVEREREQWHFGQRPSGTIWRTSHALCYQKRGRSVSSIMLLMHCLHSGSYIHVVILTLNAGTDAGSVGFYKPEKICSASKSEFKMIRKHAERKFHSKQLELFCRLLPFQFPLCPA